MTTDIIIFEGGHIFNNKKYPAKIMAQSIPMLKQMGNNVDTRYATVDVSGAERDLASQGYSLRQTSSVDVLTNINPSLIENRIEDIIKDYFEESIQIKDGDDVILRLIQYTLDNQVAHYTDNFFTSASRSEGTYYSYQLTFYSMRKASFCFLVLSLISFKDQDVIFGITTQFRTGISYNAQVFEVKKTYNNVLYNFGILKNGESMGSPDGRYEATLSNDGNFSLGSRWETGTAGKGSSPWYLAMQENANLVIYNGNDKPTWASQTEVGRFSVPPWRLELQDDGNLVIYDSKNSALWAIGMA
ncbi:hypothetical protein B0H21DRAFT_503960 [Amylocystis lapponica]|nr:hypothetical protein B0H21DRAFT_503960 [Amylocystis lapponica]